MKKFLIMLLSLAFLTGLFGCAEKAPQGNGGNESEKPPVITDPDPIPPESGDEPFTATLVYDGSVFTDAEEMSAYWKAEDGSEIKETPFNENGISEIYGLDGEYVVSLSGVPEGFTYNPNIYKVNNDSRNVRIELYKLVSIGRGNKGTNISDDIINLTKLGAYRLEFKEAGQQIYCQYVPSKNGVYSIESIMDVWADEINPRIDVYVGTTQWKPPTPTKSIDDGGASSVYTRNFKYEVSMTEKERGSVYAFALKVDSRIPLPVSVDFMITRNGAFEGVQQNVELVIPNEVPQKASEYSSKFVYFGIDDTKNGVLDGKRVAIAPDGCYHLKDADGNITETILYAKIVGMTKLVDLQDYQVNMRLIDKDYMFFIRGYSGLKNAGHPFAENYKDTPSYFTAVNSDGVCAVTEELKNFLQDFCEQNTYFFDGMGWAEGAGYNSTDENMWLCFCGYYN